ncbi:TauD/TfdA family dioxygenase [Sphingomonas naphthae]|uniref:TauD/TfdA family dioxygenase n=1 Tax=Sphingomonas naphthae TaxID=1813468 RepID=A0ABY7TLS4_9SPHN|nr:TauD/TfdA family dioxygenase [Sphingomonas naphthae]WCT74165.1 TauD/TfdA family dioxygenase [Sphingomonas naphthae]
MATAPIFSPYQQGELTVTPVQPTLGAEISGVDLSQPLEQPVVDEIRALLVKHKVIFFRDQHITREQQLAFTTRFGPPVIHPLQQLREKRRQQDLPEGVHAIVPPSKEDDYVEKTRTWHADGSWTSPIAFATSLRAVHVPDVGGDTIFADTGSIYRALPDRLKARLEGLFIAHEYKDLYRKGVAHPIIAHPAVINHPETDEDLLFVDFIMFPTIIGLDRAEGEALLTELYEEVQRPEHHVRFHWKEGSIAVWDNRSTLHTAIRDYGDFPRVMERVVVGSDYVPFRDPARRFTLPAA